MGLLLDEARKHRANREVWVSILVCCLFGGISLMTLRADVGPLPDEFTWQYWYQIQQNIHSFGAMTMAILLTVSLPRIFCCETELRTDRLVRTSAHGCRQAWTAKTLYIVLFCAAAVFVLGTVTLLAHGSAFDFRGAFFPVADSMYWSPDGLPPRSNLAYCIIQYGLLFLGSLYYAGFVMLVSILTKRTALSIFICGGIWVLLYGYGLSWFNEFLVSPLDTVFCYSFGGFMDQTGFSHAFAGEAPVWANLWKPVLFVLLMIAAEFGLSWLVWRRKAKK